jgi:hypothetical protein
MQRFGVADVDIEELDIADHVVKIRETTGGKVVDYSDIVSGSEQTADDMRADEARSPRD